MAFLDLSFQAVPIGHGCVWEAQELLNRTGTSRALDFCQELCAGRLAHEIRNGRAALASQSFQQLKLLGLHENLNSLRLGHTGSMHMHTHMSS